jgi:hypothetical protein
MYMGKFCRFCGSKFGRVISLNIKTITDEVHELRWCTECGKIQNEY